ncbi:ABC transporter ATP-binding protein [Sinorhizobium meliloti]|uniref:ABC transporter ATP-binding protein n=1 Tax=Rhizobium meliloti TaxID=382 RepID=UPI000BB1E725|nr:ABC transporter ATP-binding protein [Sinorhizobium meliloti]ATA95110.1 ABC transporter ATP-binding protein [Sinorhizobium meliloti]
MKNLIEVRNLNIAYGGPSGWTNVVQDVSFEIAPGEAFGLVGESGCGKSTVAYRLLGYGTINSLVQTGEVLFDGTDLLKLDAASLMRLRGNRIAFVPQNPTTSLSPGMRVGSQICEMIATHKALPDGMTMERRIVELFTLVGLPDVGHRYPHELSGGQQQRVTIAMAVACNPDLLVLDEPTTGLDVTTQRQIIQLLADLRSRIGMAMLYVTHDLALLAQIADRVGVMYAGQLVEVAPCDKLLSAPAHPYSRGLIASIPTNDGTDRQARSLRGMLRRDEMSTGCKFEPRCDFATGACRATPQLLELIEDARSVACMRWREATAPLAPSVTAKAVARTAVRSESLLSVTELSLSYQQPGLFNRLLGRTSPAVVREINLNLAAGEVVALVGESGSGKSTIARAISGRLPPRAGIIRLDGTALAPSLKDRSVEELRQIQYIFQNPDASLNPRRLRLFERTQELDDSCLYRNVERREDLVTDQQLRIDQKGAKCCSKPPLDSKRTITSHARPPFRGRRPYRASAVPSPAAVRARSAIHAPKTGHPSRSRLPASSAAISLPKHWYATPPRQITTARRSRSDQCRDLARDRAQASRRSALRRSAADRTANSC